MIIGITGTLGAGKGTIVDYLVNKKGFNHYSVRDFLIRALNRVGMPINRDSMTHLANALRQANGPAYIVEELYAEASAKAGHAIIESIRTPGEIALLRSKGNFVLLAVDAKPELRYQRIKERGSETDQVNFETFLANEEREMYSSDPNHQNLSECIRQADFVLNNNGSTTELFAQLDDIISKLNI